MLEEFLDHKLLINIQGASIDELKELDKIINMPYLSGDRLYEKYVNRAMYLHHRAGKDGLSFSNEPVDVFDGYKPIPFVMYYELFKDIKISPEEIESLFV